MEVSVCTLWLSGEWCFRQWSVRCKGPVAGVGNKERVSREVGGETKVR